MLEVRLYESPDVQNRTAGLDMALPVSGLSTWNASVGTEIRIVGLKYSIVKMFPTVGRDKQGNAYIYARVEYTGGVGSLSGWLVHATQLPGGRWAAKLAHLLRGSTDHVATADTQRGALEAANKVCKALGIDCG